MPGLSVAWVFEPCVEVGGDILNVRRPDEDHDVLELRKALPAAAPSTPGP